MLDPKKGTQCLRQKHTRSKCRI